MLNLVNFEISLLLMSGLTQKNTLRFATAGSVDDGKSTLIGRLLSITQGRNDSLA
jgi:GTPase